MITVLLASAWVSSLQAQDLAKDRAQGADQVDVAQCQEWLGTLAGPDFAGRGTGQEGYRKAAEYVAKHFKALGLEARGADGTYYQHVPWSQTTIHKSEITISKDGETVWKIPAERMSGRISRNTNRSGEVLLLNIEVPQSQGRKITPIEGLDEVDAEGKVVVAVVRATGRTRQFARFRIMSALQGKNAAALIFATTNTITGGLTGGSGMSRRGRNPAASASRNRPLDLNIGGDDFIRLLGLANLTPESFEEGPLATDLSVKADIAIEIKEENAPAMNVWGVLPGSDPNLKEEYVVVGSHLDHLGKRGNSIYPGADDDGSGTTGVMAVAQMFAKNDAKQRPKRSILFVCFSGEERGLIGSNYFVKNCPIPLSAIAAELQMDMIGRSEEESKDGGRLVNKGETAQDNANVLHLVGTEKLSSGLHNICMESNSRAGFDIEFDSESLFTRSDHANFAYQGIPIAFFFTGIHKDYHQKTDTPDKIEYPKLLRVARYVYDIAFEVANRDDRPTVDEDLWAKFKGSDRRGRMPSSPVAPMTKQ
jgi:hypothetical protein